MLWPTYFVSVRNEDVQVLLGFDSMEYAAAYLKSAMFTSGWIPGRSRYAHFHVGEVSKAAGNIGINDIAGRLVIGTWASSLVEIGDCLFKRLA